MLSSAIRRTVPDVKAPLLAMMLSTMMFPVPAAAVSRVVRVTVSLVTVTSVAVMAPSVATMSTLPLTLMESRSTASSSSIQTGPVTPLMLRVSMSVSMRAFATLAGSLPTMAASVMLSSGVSILPPALLLVSMITPSASRLTLEPAFWALTLADRTMSPPVVSEMVPAPPAPVSIRSFTIKLPVLDSKTIGAASSTDTAPVTVMVSSAVIVTALISTFALTISNSLSLSRVV